MNLFQSLVPIQRGGASRFYNVWLRLLGVRMNGYVWLRRISVPRQWSDITLERGASLDDGVVLLCSGPPRADKIVIRSGAYINRHTMLDASEGIEVGRNCMIGPFCYITDHDHAHDLGTLVSAQPLVGKPVSIENDVWMGAKAVILKGVRVGAGAVIGAGAVVTKDVPSGAKMVGVPARQIGQRG